MNKTIIRLVIATCFMFFLSVFSFTFLVHSWGFFAHKKINKMAVFTLPPEMVGFYKRHIAYVSAHAVDADKRRYAVVEEAPRHYIDLEYYEGSSWDSIPKYWDKAVETYTEDSLYAYGIVPWHVVLLFHRLQRAFEKENLHLILKYSADIGHYIADAHVPLHTTENYNGQLTNQVGIHGFWESRIPELNANDYNYWTGKAKYIDDPTEAIWKTIFASHAAVDSVLSFEAQLNAKFPSDKKYSFEKRGTKTIQEYSVEYSNEYDKMLQGMIERRMTASVLMVGSFWYTAWVNAGKPDLEKLMDRQKMDSLQLMEIDYFPDTLLFEKLKGH